MRDALRWAPAAMLAVGALLTVGIDTQRSLSLSGPIAAAVPEAFDGARSADIVLTDAEVEVAGTSAYLMREYTPAKGFPFSVYVGYYNQQTQGRTIHSPRNCLPGGGWEALTSRREMIATAGGSVAVNRYLIQKGDQQALVLYWYQGRGRVAANEYVVKFELLRDAAIRRRSEEALVRIVVPIDGSQATALARATVLASQIIPALFDVLPS